MVAETWLYNPWVVAIGSGILLILFEEIISAYKGKKVYHRPRWQRTEVRCFLFYKTNLLYIYNTNTKMTFQIILIPNGVMYNQSLFRNFGFCL